MNYIVDTSCIHYNTKRPNSKRSMNMRCHIIATYRGVKLIKMSSNLFKYNQDHFIFRRNYSKHKDKEHAITYTNNYVHWRLFFSVRTLKFYQMARTRAFIQKNTQKSNFPVCAYADYTNFEKKKVTIVGLIPWRTSITDIILKCD